MSLFVVPATDDFLPEPPLDGKPTTSLGHCRRRNGPSEVAGSIPARVLAIVVVESASRHLALRF